MLQNNSKQDNYSTQFYHTLFTGTLCFVTLLITKPFMSTLIWDILPEDVQAVTNNDVQIVFTNHNVLGWAISTPG